MSSEHRWETFMLNIQKCKALDGSFMRPWDYFMRIYSPFCDLNVSHSNRVTLDSPLGWCAWWGVSLHSCTTIHSSQLVSDQWIWKLKLWRALYPLSAHRFDLLPHLLYLQCWYSVVMVFHNFHKRLPHDTHKRYNKELNSSEEHEESSLLLEMPFNWHGGKKLI